MVEREREVGLAAAEVDDAQRPLLPKRRHDVVDELQEPVHLPELVEPALADAAVGRHHAELDQVGDGRALLEQVALATVVPASADRPCRRPTEHGRAQHLPVGVSTLQQALAIAGQEGRQPLARGRRGEILVDGTIGELRREPVRELPAHLDRLDSHPRGKLALRRLRESRAGQAVLIEQAREKVVELGHGSMMSNTAAQGRAAGTATHRLFRHDRPRWTWPGDCP